MKKVLLILIVFPFILASCSKKSDDLNDSGIVGTWVFHSTFAQEVKTNNVDATKQIKDDIASYNEKNEDTYIFTAEGIVVMMDGDYSLNGKYIFENGLLTVTVMGKVAVNSVNLSGNTFTSDTDETEYYQEVIEYLLPNVKDVIVSKVIARYTFKRK